MNTTENLPEQIVNAIRSVVGDGPVLLHEPSFTGCEWKYVKECLDSTFVSSIGKFVERFEHDLAEFTGAKYVVAVSSGTAALHVALRLAGVKSGDEVLVPALTFIATPNAVTYCNATPHFIESELGTLGVDAFKLRDYLLFHTEQRSGHCFNRITGNIIRALVPMHAFGHPADVDSLLSVAHDFNIVIVEDAAESIGSYYQSRHTGTFGLLGTLSFNGNKTITTGGGGAILTNNYDLACHAKHLTTTAKLPHAWEFNHDEIGYNYRMPNLNAALGCAQLEQLPIKISAKRELFGQYQIAFERITGVSLMSEPAKCKSNYWLQTLLLNPENANLRDEVLRKTNAAGYMTRPAWMLMNELIPFKECPSMDLAVAQSITKRLINIPSSSGLL